MKLFGRRKKELENYWFPQDLSYLFTLRVNYYFLSDDLTVRHKGFNSLTKKHYIAGVRRLGYNFFERRRLFHIAGEKTSQLLSEGEILAHIACYQDRLLAKTTPNSDLDGKLVDIRGASSQLKKY